MGLNSCAISCIRISMMPIEMLYEGRSNMAPRSALKV